MFHAHLLLSKRGPLAKIWLAAHGGKKLTKAHVFECNLERALESIILPKVTVALNLLLAVVRIYNRKAKYLLADCNEALIKMNFAFSPHIVDLPEENLEATNNAITLLEKFHDFDMQLLPDLNELDVAEHLTLNRSRGEDITVREDYGKSALHDSFANENEIFKQGNILDETLLMSSNNSFQAEHNSAFPFADQGVMYDNRLLLTLDGFGDDMLDSFLSIKQDVLTEDDLGISKEISLPMAFENSSMANAEKKNKRKRKLFVDMEKELRSSTISSQLTDFLDTITTVAIAPSLPPRKLMTWKETGGVENLLSNSSQCQINMKLQKLFVHCLGHYKFKTGRKGDDLKTKIEEQRKQQELIAMTVLEKPSYLQQSKETETNRTSTDEKQQEERFIPG
uniref:LOW QUALITY PROTEIN: double-strand-break repair protein rad21-like protein 1 n=1 Tax=Geotrypetes seraphini TaxID=260995 RepID=A0A6P8Q7P3_GEOSA|nr:LOW QUALITY PROTEIN: double-strand-break repair protein rad21-like protein 1 [Geotrypetes seraphini]